MVAQGTRFEFHVLIFNKNQVWTKVETSVIQTGRYFTFSLPPHQAVKIYYRNFGVTVAPSENNSGGGCFLHLNKN